MHCHHHRSDYLFFFLTHYLSLAHHSHIPGVDKDLRELVRGHWIVHKCESFLESLSPWHQNNFTQNGLFAEVLVSNTTKIEFEEELLQLLRAHCPPGQCKLAGSSVHCDREVLLLEHPLVYQHLSHAIVDVSTMKHLLYAWNRDLLYEMMAQTGPPRSRSFTNHHRTTGDIETSLAELKFMEPIIRVSANPWPRRAARVRSRQEEEQARARRQLEEADNVLYLQLRRQEEARQEEEQARPASFLLANLRLSPLTFDQFYNSC